jgi:glutamyl-Q tRNA(Asp) synthetase
MSSLPIVRFAPSPNGYLHLGHALSACLNQDFAARRGGRFLLRIEDIDRSRWRPEFDQAIEEDLTWLGLDWERPVRRQSEHYAVYQRALTQLKEAGLIYPCFCTRGQIMRGLGPQALRDPDGAPLYPGLCRDLSADEAWSRAEREPHHVRLNMQAALLRLSQPLMWSEMEEAGNVSMCVAQPEQWGDVVLGRKDIGTSYHMAVVVDDALQGITQVIRGYDLYFATAIHRLLQTLLNLPEPTYHHHRLILDEEGHKLAKRDGAQSLRELRAMGWSAQQVRQALGL